MSQTPGQIEVDDAWQKHAVRHTAAWANYLTGKEHFQASLRADLEAIVKDYAEIDPHFAGGVRMAISRLDFVKPL